MLAKSWRVDERPYTEQRGTISSENYHTRCTGFSHSSMEAEERGRTFVCIWCWLMSLHPDLTMGEKCSNASFSRNVQMMKVREVTAGSSNSERYYVFKAYTELLEEYNCAISYNCALKLLKVFIHHNNKPQVVQYLKIFHAVWIRVKINTRCLWEFPLKKKCTFWFNFLSLCRLWDTKTCLMRLQASDFFFLRNDQAESWLDCILQENWFILWLHESCFRLEWKKNDCGGVTDGVRGGG